MVLLTLGRLYETYYCNLIDEYDRDINNGNGGPGEIALKTGLHPVRILYYDVERPASIDLFMQKTGGERKR